MKKSLLIACLAILAFIAITMPSYAAVQNIKLSGDLLMRGISRWQFDFVGDKTDDGATVMAGAGAWNENGQNYFMTTARVRLDADLTDNVSATVRVLNERKWGNKGTDSNHANGNPGYKAGSGIDTNDDNVRIDLAYATLKEFLYAPLTLTIGRQRMQFGNGMIVGDWDTNLAATTGYATAPNPSTVAQAGGPQGAVMNRWGNFGYYNPAPDLSEDKSFDAIRATINLDPLTMDLLYAKLDEQDPALADDLDLWGLNTGYKFDLPIPFFSEIYYFGKYRGKDYVNDDTGVLSAAAGATREINKNDQVHTLGARVSLDPAENLNVQFELAGQVGRYNPRLDPNDSGASTVNGVARAAWATELSVNYDIPKWKFNPKFMGSYAFFSGDPKAANRDPSIAPVAGNAASSTSGAETYNGWDPMFENQTFGHIANALFKQTNMHIWMLKSSFTPLQDINVDLGYSYYRLNRGFNQGDRVILNGLFGGRAYFMNAHDHLGQELDANITYDYTEDVQFGLLGGLFFPGNAFMESGNGGQFLTNHKTASEVIGSMKVTF
ncbi:MAG: alginate export family protein [Candidatus Omnitrophota bacterium]